jgi:hypothetical protein
MDCRRLLGPNIQTLLIANVTTRRSLIRWLYTDIVELNRLMRQLLSTSQETEEEIEQFFTGNLKMYLE